MLALSVLNLKSGTKHTNHKLHMCHMDHQHNYYRLLTAGVLQQFFNLAEKNQNWEWILETLRDALSFRMIVETWVSLCFEGKRFQQVRFVAT